VAIGACGCMQINCTGIVVLYKLGKACVVTLVKVLKIFNNSFKDSTFLILVQLY